MHKKKISIKPAAKILNTAKQGCNATNKPAGLKRIKCTINKESQHVRIIHNRIISTVCGKCLKWGKSVVGTYTNVLLNRG